MRFLHLYEASFFLIPTSLKGLILLSLFAGFWGGCYPWTRCWGIAAVIGEPRLLSGSDKTVARPAFSDGGTPKGNYGLLPNLPTRKRTLGRHTKGTKTGRYPQIGRGQVLAYWKKKIQIIRKNRYLTEMESGLLAFFEGPPSAKNGNARIHQRNGADAQSIFCDTRPCKAIKWSD